MRRLVAIAPLLIVACADKTVPLPPPATTSIGPEGGLARSADGVVTVEVVSRPSRMSAGSLTITPVAGTYPDQITLAYRITSDLSAFDAELRFYVPGIIPVDHLAIGELDGDRLRELPLSQHEPGLALVLAPVSTFSDRTFAAIDRAWDPCAGRGCGEGCSPCAPSHPGCAVRNHRAFCDREGACTAGDAPSCRAEQPPGWDEAVGTGRAFVVNAIAIGDSEAAFDVDGTCWAPGRCGDNALTALGELGNDPIRQGLLGGEALTGLELRGASDAPAEGDRATVSLLALRDADDPFFPANNFSTPPGLDSCCEFLVRSVSLEPDLETTRDRIAVTRKGGAWVTGEPAELALLAGCWPELVMSRSMLTVHERADGVIAGRLGGALPARVLAAIDNPYCKTVSPRCPMVSVDSNLADLVFTVDGTQPDVDLDGDGLERAEDRDLDGRLDTCWDGCIGNCTAPELIPPADPQDPTTCLSNPRFADGYSVVFELTMVEAKLLGVAN